MIKSIRHLRATDTEWKSNDIVVPDGEIAILKSSSGVSKLKVGNGIDTFSSLPTITGDSVKTDKRDLTLLHGRSYRLGECASLVLQVPSNIDDDYYSEVSFDSGINATEFLMNTKVRLSGDGVADEELMPREKTHYTLFIWYDGELQGIVRGIPNA